jgi:hypothetical protein
MRLTFLAIAGCLACDSGAAKVAVVAPAEAPPTAAASPEAVSTAPGGATPASAQTGEDKPRVDGQPGCSFQRPEVWAGGQVAWLGDCQNGFAEGNGVLVNVVEGAAPERFYGHLASGSPSIGVLQTESGFVAGRWKHGAIAGPLPDDVAQRNVMLDAFRAAASAATAVSMSFAKKADAEESSFYSRQARLLNEQMD